MAKRQWQWVLSKKLSAEAKAEIAAACQKLITERLIPRHLPQIRPTPFNFPVAITGKWRGSKYTFMLRYRSGFPENAGEEFDSGFTRLDHREDIAGEPRFDVMWHRHTGQWFRLHDSVTLEEALHLVETEDMLQPPT